MTKTKIDCLYLANRINCVSLLSEEMENSEMIDKINKIENFIKTKKL